jgi:hypothetical protein
MADLVGVVGTILLIVICGTTDMVRWLAKPLTRCDTLEEGIPVAVLDMGNLNLEMQQAADLIQRNQISHVFAMFTNVRARIAIADISISEKMISYLPKPSQNTYDDIQYLKRILQRNGFHKIGVITAPYHTTRVAAVAKRQGLNLATIPVPDSLWYHAPPWQWNSEIESPFLIRHVFLSEILHEYIGFVGYWCLGYL